MPHPLSYPVGPFDLNALMTADSRAAAIGDLATLPETLRAAVAGLTAGQLATPYRPGGWTVRQVVHHVADSHINGFIRTKLALTEEAPTIKPYDQDAWADLVDSQLPIEISLNLLESVHRRWVAVAEHLAAADVARTFIHPEVGRMTLDQHLHLYGWHSRHHVAHITGLRQREGW